MNRAIVTRRDVLEGRAAAPRTPRAPGAPVPADAPDSYFTRLMKLIPAEVVGAYLTLEAILRGAGTSFPLPNAEWWLFGLGVAATPAYLLRVGGVRRPSQLVISTLAFVAWAFAMRGPFESVPGQPALGAALVVLFVFVLPLFTG